MTLDEMLLNCSTKQKKGLHFILASIIIWSAVFLVHTTSLPILTKNSANILFYSASGPGSLYDFKNH